MKPIAQIAFVILCLAAIQPAFAQHGNGTTTVVATTNKTLSETDKITKLIEEIRSMQGATFIRNGSEHSCKEAADHLQAKWEKHGKKIKSAEEFIEYLATKSSASGETYKIRFADGREAPTAELLYERLKSLE